MKAMKVEKTKFLKQKVLSLYSSIRGGIGVYQDKPFMALSRGMFAVHENRKYLIGYTDKHGVIQWSVFYDLKGDTFRLYKITLDEFLYTGDCAIENYQGVIEWRFDEIYTALVDGANAINTPTGRYFTDGEFWAHCMEGVKTIGMVGEEFKVTRDDMELEFFGIDKETFFMKTAMTKFFTTSEGE